MEISDEFQAVLDNCKPAAAERLPQGVKASAANFILFAEEVIELLRKFPQDMPVHHGSLLDISLPPLVFRELFAGKEVTIKRDDCIVEMWVYWRYIQIRCMDYEEVETRKKQEVITLPQPAMEAA